MQLITIPAIAPLDKLELLLLLVELLPLLFELLPLLFELLPLLVIVAKLLYYCLLFICPVIETFGEDVQLFKSWRKVDLSVEVNLYPFNLPEEEK